MKANSICSSGVDGARFTPGLTESWVAAVLCGTLCGCGGGMWATTFGLDSPQWQFTGTPGIVLQPTYDMKASLFVASAYTALTSGRAWWLQLFGMENGFTRDEGKVVIFLLMVVLHINKVRIRGVAEKAKEDSKGMKEKKRQ
jgi:hypothetical protein